MCECGRKRRLGRNFCPSCKRVYDLNDLRRVRLQGPESDSVSEFWETGDPSVFARPGAPDYRGR